MLERGSPYVLVHDAILLRTPACQYLIPAYLATPGEVVVSRDETVLVEPLPGFSFSRVYAVHVPAKRVQYKATEAALYLLLGPAPVSPHGRTDEDP